MYVLTPLQEGILFHSIIDEGNETYIEQASFDIKGTLDKDLIEQSLNKLVERYDVLRTVFSYTNVKKALQIVLKQRKAKIDYQDISNMNEGDKQLFLETFMEEDRKKGFNLTKDILMRLAVFKTQEKSYKIIWTFHHIIMDGWCIGVIMQEFFEIYSSLVNNKPIRLKSVQPYSKFIKWLENKNTEAALSFWETYLKDFNKKSIIPHQIKKDVLTPFKQEEFVFNLASDVSEKLKAVADDNAVTLSIVFQAIWGILLQKYNDTQDAVFGLVVSGRQAEIAGIQDMVGLFINTIATRVRSSKETQFSDMIKEMQEAAVTSSQYDYVQLGEIQKRSSVGQGLIDTLFVYENYPVDKMVSSTDVIKELQLEVSNMQMYEKTNYDFNILIGMGEELEIRFKYNASLYSKEFIKNLKGHIDTIIEQVISNPDIRVSEIEILTTREKNEILYTFNDTKAEYDRHKTLYQVFEEQAKKTPENIAATFNDNYLTYQGLNEKSNQLARVLRSYGVKKGSIVGIMTQRSLEMIIGIMGILKAGGAYLPLDPSHPKERLEYVLKDSKTNILLTSKELISKTNITFNGEMIDLYDNSLYNGDRSNLVPVNTSKDLAYVIYTSGSTGKPKGTLIEHFSVINRINWMQKKYPITENDRILQKTPYTFDVSVWELFWWSFVGGSVCFLKPEGEKDPECILNTIYESKATVMHFVPSMLNAFLEYIDENEDLYKAQSLRQVFASGEALGALQVKKFNALLNKRFETKLANLYGPTEATVDVSYFDCSIGEEFDIIPIGKPIDNIHLYIVGKDMKLQPVGIPGELCISGDGLARGYLNRPELTKEKFVSNPFISDTRMYRTGDLARWLPDGNIEFLGRIDHQVKIRGNRIELGEIEAELLKVPAVKEAVVIAKQEEGKDSSLYAFMVSDKELEDLNVKEYLLGKLPEYMIPSFFIKLDKIPLSPNGKADRAALMAKALVFNEKTEYVNPRNIEEEKLVELYSKILNAQDIGVKDSFITLGGDSIKAIRLFSLINKELNTHIKIKDIYQYPVIEDLARYIRSNINDEEYNRILSVKQRLEKFKEDIIESKKLDEILLDAEDLYPMSDIQKGMIYHSVLEQDGAVYHDQFVYQVQDVFDEDCFNKAMDLLIVKHPILRTSFNIQDVDEAIQIVHKKIKRDIKIYDISDKNKLQQQTYMQNYLKQDRGNAFDPSDYPLWRMRIFKLDDKRYCLCWIFHHAILDGWSNASFINELVATYQMLKENKDYVPSPLSCTYKDYIIEQLSIKEDQKTKDYWKKELDGYKKLAFYKKHKETGEELKSIEYENRNADQLLLKDIKACAKKYGTDVRTIMFSAYLYMLQMISYENDIVVGLVENNRPNCEDSDKILGCFLNTIPVRMKFEEAMTWENFVLKVKEKLLELKSYGRISLLEIANICNEKFSSDSPLFNTMFYYTDFHILEGINIGELKEDQVLEVDNYERTNTSLDIAISTTFNELNIRATYQLDVFDKQDIDKLLDYYMNILDKIIHHGSEQIRKEKVLTKYERHQMTEVFNKTDERLYDKNTVTALFDQQAENNPDDIALVFQSGQMTYRELKEKSEKLACFLKNQGVQRDNLIGIMVKPSMEMLIGILGILKSGAAYLPIDPGYPADRIHYMLEKSNAKVLLVDSDSGNNIIFNGEKIEINDERIYSNDASCFTDTTKAHNLAYVIYTSGSTGNPKGVMIEHEAVTNFIKGVTKRIGFSKDSSILALTTISFDIFVLETLLPLTQGLKVVIADEEQQKDARLLKELILRSDIDMLQMTPSRLQMLAAYDKELDCLADVKVIMVGGEPFNEILLHQLQKKKNLRIYNMYGPTETTVWSTIQDLTDEQNINIGKPISNTKIFIVDKNNELLPLGIPGELCIGGNGLARGYFGNEKLTREKFINSPLNPEEKIYKTGDLVRWLPDGDIEFMGRLDHQVKIRGFRIECGEIESNLKQYEGIKQAIVTDKEDRNGNKYLCAYFVADREILNAELREHLLKKLPDYMIPSYFVQLDKFPLTPNGKIDRKKLLAPNELMVKSAPFVAPTNEMEETIAKIWREVLNTQKIGIHDNFIEVGGDSIKAMQVVSRLSNLGLNVSIKDLLLTGTIKELASFIQKSTVEFKAIYKAKEQEYYPLSSSQRKFYALHFFDHDSTVYNMPAIIGIDGALDKDRVQEVLDLIIKRHEILRTSFYVVNGQPVQKVHDKVSLELDYKEIKEADIDKEIKSFVKPFELNKAPLMRVCLAKINDNKHVIMMDMAHIITDRLSMSILSNEFIQLYSGKPLPKMTIQYKDFAQWQNQLLESEFIKKQKEYWNNLFAKDITVLNMPLDYSRKSAHTFNGNTIKHELNKELVERLEDYAKKHHITLNVLLFAVYALLLSKYSEQEDVVIGTIISGRNRVELEHLIGAFMNFLPVRMAVSREWTFEELVKNTNQSMLTAYENQDYPFEQIVQDVYPREEVSRNPLFDTMLIFHNDANHEVINDLEELKFYSYDYDENSSALDFKLDVFSNSGTLGCRLEYNTDLFKFETMDRFFNHFIKLLETVTLNSSQKLKEIQLFDEKESKELAEKREINKMADKETFKLAVSSTFTAEPIESYIKWWGSQFSEVIDVKFAPYNQVFKQLLDPKSMICTNTKIILLLIRFEDLIREDQSSDEEKCIKLEQYYNELLEAIHLKNYQGIPFVGLFPVSNSKAYSSLVINKIEELNKRWAEALKLIDNLYIVDFREIDKLYEIKEVFDETKDKIGHMPFSDEFFAAMGTTIARHICAWKRQAFKVVVVDCDNTLWKGICGEDGSLGVSIDAPYRDLQRFLIQKYNEGMLLALCSKNNEEDVFEVFEHHKDMILKKEHIAAYRINWKSKAENIKELHQELNVGLDSFIFIDDSPVEIAEVMEKLPQVLSLKLPEDQQNFSKFLRHVWAFDSLKITSEDRNRTEMYRAEKKRQQLKMEGYSLEKYLKNLELKVAMYPLSDTQISRAAQLTQRTNQFNLTTIRRTEEEIKELIAKPNTICWVLEATDRFGTYGTVGMVIACKGKNKLFVETFLLSCRVLGRGVEDAVLAGIKKYCEQAGIQVVQAQYIRTEKNGPVLQFLEKGLWVKEKEQDDKILFHLEAEKMPVQIEHIELFDKPLLNNEQNKESIAKQDIKTFETGKDEILIQNETSVENEKTWEVFIENDETLLHLPYLKALRVHTGMQLLKLPVHSASVIKKSASEYEAPRNEVEKKIAKVWKELLGAKKISIHDNFLDLGGDSIKIVIAISMLKKFNLKIELADMLSKAPLWEIASKAVELSNEKEQEIIQGEVKMTAVQRCFFERNFTDPGHWTAAVILHKKDMFDEDIVKRVFTKIAEYHDALRMVFYKENERIIQYNRGIEKKLFDYECIDLGDTLDYRNIIERESYRIQNEINLQIGPLLKLGHFKTIVGDYLLVACHHLACDGFSMTIILSDFMNGYNQVLNNKEIRFEEKTDSYMKWADELNRRANSTEFLKETEFWSQLEESKIPKLPRDFDSLSVRRFNTSKSVRGVLLTAEEVNHLKRAALEGYHTSVQNILLTGLGQAIKDWTGEDKVLIRMGGHGRDVINGALDATRTVGWFGISYPIILDMSDSSDISLKVNKTTETMKSVPGKGEGYDMLKYLTLPENKKSMTFNLEPEIYFNNKVVFFDYEEAPDETEEELFKISDITPIDRSMYTEREYTFNFTLELEEDHMILDIDFDVNEYKEETIQYIFERYKSNLQKILYEISIGYES